MSRDDIASMTRGQIVGIARDMGAPAYRAGQIYSWLRQRGARSFDEMTDIPKGLRDELNNKFKIFSCKIKKKLVSDLDNTVKYIYELHDGETVEAVLMSYKYGRTLCVSTQAGCRMGCEFCASAIEGLARDLTPSEMLAQIHAAQRDVGERVSRVVLMGMGEPLDNYENVLNFLGFVSEPGGLEIGMRNISLSTCGIVPKIYDLAERRMQLTLSVSLHAPDDGIRGRIMPVNRKWGVDELLSACGYYAKTTGRRISFEYAMLSGVNDSEECAARLASKLKNILCHVNLIPANAVAGRGYERSGPKSIERFESVLRGGGINVTVRRSLGADINASCGQLRRAYKSGVYGA